MLLIGRKYMNTFDEAAETVTYAAVSGISRFYAERLPGGMVMVVWAAETSHPYEPEYMYPTEDYKAPEESSSLKSMLDHGFFVKTFEPDDSFDFAKACHFTGTYGVYQNPQGEYYAAREGDISKFPIHNSFGDYFHANRAAVMAEAHCDNADRILKRLAEDGCDD